MSETKRRMGALRVLRFVAALAFSIYSVSSLMPLLMHVILRGATLTDGISIIGYLFVAFLSICTIARMIYTLDRKAGRIRNRIGWFE
jgi:hypothetical protein